jgi:outer membrane protein insertion porin family
VVLCLVQFWSWPADASPQDQVGPTTTVPVPKLPQLTNLNTYEGMVIASVELRGVEEDSRVYGQLRDVVDVQKGQRIDRQKLRRTIRALYATGRFSNIQLEIERTGSGEAGLVFQLTPNYFIGSVRAHGAPNRKRPTNGQLVDSSKLQLGEVLTQGKITQAIQRMKTLLEVNGFYRSNIAVSQQLDPKRQLASVYFEVTPGPPAHIGTITVEGDPGYTPQEIGEISKLRTGRTVTEKLVTKGLTKLRKHYTKGDRLESQINIVDRQYRADKNALDMVIRIERGPTVDVRVEGTSLSRGKLKKFVPIYEEHAVDNDLLNEGRRNIRDYLQRQG